MRRVITFALVMALTYAGLGVFAPAQRSPGTGIAGTTAARLTAQAGRPGFKVVRYAGYTIRVPAGWPVYRLDRDPSRCVRYDRHAVYLGTPGANQQCPAHLVGRTATISIQAAGPGTAGSPGPGSGPAGPVNVGPAIGTVPQVGASVTRDTTEQEMRASLADPGVSVTGTYAGDTGGVLSILRSLRRAGGARAAARTTATTTARTTATTTARTTATTTARTTATTTARTTATTTARTTATTTARTTASPGRAAAPRR